MGPQRTRAKTPVGDDQILAVYQSVLGADSIRRHDKTDGWFGRYCGSLADPRQGQRYLRAIRNSLQLHKRPASGLRILEVGCGFGLTCLSLSLMGAESVDCLDTNEQMIATMSSYLQDLPFELQIKPRTGLAYDLPYADAQFDLVITIEALSHFLQPQRCLAEAHRVLKPGGQYVIADDNNALNRLSVQATREVWDRFENGPPTDDIHGHRVREPYVNRRMRLMIEAFPALTPQDAEVLASKTCYMVKAELLEAARRYLDDGTLPACTFQPDRCPVEPETGQFIENLIDPLALAAQLESIGFTTRVEAYFGGESRGGAVYAINNLLNGLLPRSLLLARSDGFRVRARKT